VFEGVLMCLDVFGREIRERIYLGTFFFLGQNEGYGGIYSKKVPFWLLANLEGPLATLLTLAILAFSQFKFGSVFKGLPRP